MKEEGKERKSFSSINHSEIEQQEVRKLKLEFILFLSLNFFPARASILPLRFLCVETIFTYQPHAPHIQFFFHF